MSGEQQNLFHKKLGTEGGVQAGEAMAMAGAVMSTFRDSLQAVARNLKDSSLKKLRGQAIEFVKSDLPPGLQNKLEFKQGSMSSEAWGIASDSSLGTALDVVDVTTRIPGRLLGLSDQFFKGMGYRMELHSRAVRLARERIRGAQVSPDDFKAEVARIIKEPPTDIHFDAINAAAYQTFTNKPNELLNNIGKAIQAVPALGRLLIPFKNTPINIMTYSFERTPFAPLMKSVRADFAAGGARADIATARMVTGSMMLSLAMDEAFNGNISGSGPRHPGERANWLRQGNQPYSVRVEGEWLSINRLDPVGFNLGFGADLAEIINNAQEDANDDDISEVFAAGVFAVFNNVLSKTYMQSASEFFSAVSNPELFSKNFIRRRFSSFIPAGVSAINRAGLIPGLEADPYKRYAFNVMDAMKRRIPGLSDSLGLYRDLWGREISYSSGKGKLFDLFSPVYIRKDNPEPVDIELQRLQFFPSNPNRKMSFDGVTKELDADQFSRYMHLQGNDLKHPAWGLGLKDFLNQVVSGKHDMSQIYEIYSDGPDGGKAAFIQKWIGEYRGLAKKQLLEENTNLRTDVEEEKLMKPGKFKLQNF